MGRSGLSITLTSNLWVSLNNNVVTQVFSNFSRIKFLVSHPLIHYAFILSGTDYLSVAAFTDATAAHLVFLKGRVRIFFFGHLTCHFVTQNSSFQSIYWKKSTIEERSIYIFGDSGEILSGYHPSWSAETWGCWSWNIFGALLAFEIGRCWGIANQMHLD